MTTHTRIAPMIQPVLEAALAEGFRVFVLGNDNEPRRPIGFAYVCLDLQGSFAVVNTGHNLFDEATLAAPIKPSIDYGSGVLVDYDGTVSGAVDALRRTCEATTVHVRFMCGDLVPIVDNFGRQVMDRFPGGASGFVELQADQTASVAPAPHTTTPDREKVLSHA